MWDVATGEMLLDMPLHGGEVALEWSPDGTTLAVAGNEGVPYLLDAHSGEEVVNLVGHGSGVWSLAFSPDGSMLVSAAADGVLQFWGLSAAMPLEAETPAG